MEIQLRAIKDPLIISFEPNHSLIYSKIPDSFLSMSGIN